MPQPILPPEVVSVVMASAPRFADRRLGRWCCAHGLGVIIQGRLDADTHHLYVRPETALGRHAASRSQRAQRTSWLFRR